MLDKFGDDKIKAGIKIVNERGFSQSMVLRSFFFNPQSAGSRWEDIFKINIHQDNLILVFLFISNQFAKGLTLKMA